MRHSRRENIRPSRIYEVCTGKKMYCRIHFLNVGNGDCTIIEHQTGKISVIDICNGNCSNMGLSLESNFNYQKDPTDSIEYIKDILVDKPIFRFILTHPDMDHMDGIKNLFENFKVKEFWDTNHNKDLSNDNFKKYEEDWMSYQEKRKSKSLKVLYLHSGKIQDDFTIISPSLKLEQDLWNQQVPNWNEISYVILHEVFGRKILYCGDSEDKAWEYILDSNLLEKISNIDILFAPHHGRKTGGDKLNKYLKVLNPKLALFGNANSKDKNYQAFYNEGIPILTNNEAGNIVINIQSDGKVCIKIDNDWNSLLSKSKHLKKLFNSKSNFCSCQRFIDD